MEASELAPSLDLVTLTVATVDTTIWHDSVLEMSVFQKNMGSISKISISSSKSGSAQISSRKVTFDIGVAEVSFGQIGFFQPSINQLGTTKISPIQVSSPKVRFLQVGTSQVRTTQVCIIKPSSPQTGVAEVSSNQVRSTKIAFSQIQRTKVSSTQVDLIKDYSAQVRIPKVSTTEIGTIQEVIRDTLNRIRVGVKFSDKIGEINSHKTSLPGSIALEQLLNSHPFSVHDSTSQFTVFNFNNSGRVACIAESRMVTSLIVRCSKPR